ncbi:hypothetical protein RHSIM_Rhsim10G0202300 [Rhododendron simsii]|uniref:Thiolase N-terminal domain-containing protein n=1 Tax=Rhododendron simsii TaxID=118357 RepID=A0A834L9X3_RHOSS|nr:hypothetical protein RHSIM_Rhsim10G0202300 [Rhododendron simsii]
MDRSFRYSRVLIERNSQRRIKAIFGNIAPVEANIHCSESPYQKFSAYDLVDWLLLKQKVRVLERKQFRARWIIYRPLKEQSRLFESFMVVELHPNCDIQALQKQYFGRKSEKVDSHRKAAAATASGKFKEEIIPVATKIVDPKTGDEKPVTISVDDGIRPNASLSHLGKLKPASKKDGTTTTGNSSQVSDGAGAVLLMKRSVAMQKGLPILGVFRCELRLCYLNYIENKMVKLCTLG